MTWISKQFCGRSHEIMDFYQFNLDKMEKYSFAKSAGKGLLAFVLFTIPVVINMFPEAMNLTIGGLLVVVVNYLKFRYKTL